MDEKSTYEYIDDEVVYQTCQLRNMEPGTEEYARVAETIERLQKLNLKDTEIGSMYDSKKEEVRLKEEELELMRSELEETKANNKREFKKGLVTGLVGTLVPMAVLTGLSMIGFKFEETGSISSNTMRNVQSNTNRFIGTGI